jgi:hypothetical protein
MSLSNSRLSYDDCYEVMDQALEAADGVRVGFEDREQAIFYRMRMNQARQLDRRFNGERYRGVDYPRRGRSSYDALSMRVRRVDDMYWVYVEKRQKPQIIEEIQANKDEADRTLTETKPIREVMTHRRF